MAGYQKRLTSAHINAMVAAETVNQLVDLSGTFDPSRKTEIWSGLSNEVLLGAQLEAGFYAIVLTRNVCLMYATGVGDEVRFYDAIDPTTTYPLKYWKPITGSYRIEVDAPTNRIKQVLKVG